MPLKKLTVNHNNQINDASLQFLPPSLTQLGINYCRSITDAGIAHLTLMRLTALDLGDCIKLTNGALIHLQSQQPAIKQLNLSNCILIDDAGVAALVGLPIEELNPNDCTRVMDQGLHHLAELPLKKLDMVDCHRTSAEGRANFLALPQFERAQIDLTIRPI
jgi:hypothetical protein